MGNVIWDDEKARLNLEKHGVSFPEASVVFDDPLADVRLDREHSDEEERLKIIGFSSQSRLLLVVYTERGEDQRLISARRATTHERKQYEYNANL